MSVRRARDPKGLSVSSRQTHRAVILLLFLPISCASRQYSAEADFLLSSTISRSNRAAMVDTIHMNRSPKIVMVLQPAMEIRRHITPARPLSNSLTAITGLGNRAMADTVRQGRSSQVVFMALITMVRDEQHERCQCP